MAANISHQNPPLEIDLNMVPPLFDLNSDPFVEEDTAEMTHEQYQESNRNLDESGEEVSDIRKFHTLSNENRRKIYEMLLQKSNEGKLRKGVTRDVAAAFSVNIRTVQRIWKKSRSGPNVDVSHGKSNCGRKTIQVDLNRLRDIPLNQRTTMDSLACILKVSKSTIIKLLKSGAIRRHTNAIMPFLKEENKKSRLQFCMSMLDESTMSHDPTFKGMYNIIHIDEKWFYMTRKTEVYYLLPEEEDPTRTCKNKNFIEKVMFLAAVARPRFDVEGNEIFSGKIGVFPLVTQEPAKRNSVNRPRGTLELKPIISVTRQVIRSFLIERVIPAIKEKWPKDDLRSPIFIQQDNARTHIDDNDEEFCQAVRDSGLDIRLMRQPPKSPDLNILDLGFFSAIQSLHYKESPKTVGDLVNAVMKAFEAYSSVKSNRIFLTLQLCMVKIMMAKGSNKYKIPHVNKARLERHGDLPSQIKCDHALVQEVLAYLSSNAAAG